MEDYLDEDTIHVAGQKFAIISIVHSQTESFSAIKIKGVFETFDEANNWIKNRIMKINSETMYDTYVVDLYKWLMIPPPTNDIENQNYANQQLNLMMKAHKEEQTLAQQVFEERKQSLVNNEKTIDEN